MSLLIDLLQKIKKGRASREVPPLLERVYRRSPRRRWAYLIVVIASALSVVAGFMVVGLIKEKRIVYPRKAVLVAKKSKPKKQMSEVKAKSEKAPPISFRAKDKETKKAIKLKKTTKAQRVASSTALKNPVNTAKKTERKKQLVLKEKKPSKQKRRPINYSTPVDYYLYQAIKAEREGHLYDAVSLYKKALGHRKEKARLLNKLSYLYIRLKSPQEAISFAKKALRLQPGYVDATVNLSVALMMSGRLDEAIETLNSEFKKNPEDRRILYNLALLYEKEGDLERARDFYNRLYLLNDLRGLLGLARVQERKGNAKRAIQYYREALQMKDLTSEQREKIRGRLSLLSQAAD